MGDGAFGPAEIVVHHHHRDRGFGECVEELLHPVEVALHHLLELLFVQPHQQQQLFEPVNFDQAGKEGGVDSGGTQDAGIAPLNLRIVTLETLHQLPARKERVFFAGAEPDRLLDVGIGDAGFGGEIAAVGGEHRMSHISDASAGGEDGLPGDCDMPVQAVIPLLHEAADRLLPALLAGDLDAGDGGEQFEVAFHAVFGAWNPVRCLIADGRPAVFV